MLKLDFTVVETQNTGDLTGEILPIFRSHFSVLRSILTLDLAEDIDLEHPISVFSIARKHGLKETLVADTRFAGFPAAYRQSRKDGIALRFGIILTVCADIRQKDEESLGTEHKVIVWMLSSEGYESIIRIYSRAACDGFYYKPRVDLGTLKSLWHRDLALMILPYDSFIHRNMLQDGFCVPDWNGLEPILTFARMELPFDSLLEAATKEFAIKIGLELLEIHPVYYYRRQDFDAYLAMRCVDEGSRFERPRLDHLGSREFCFEAFLEKTKVNHAVANYEVRS